MQLNDTCQPDTPAQQVIAETLKVIYRDNDLVAVAKPSGLLVHKSKIDYHEQANVVDALTAQIQRRIYPVHRLDKATSGVLLLALNADTARLLGEQFEHRQVKKNYLAISRGYTPCHGCIDNPTRDKDRPSRPKKAATTFYRTLAHIELPHRVDRYPTSRYSLVELTPVTGRRHQIRQHMKHINHPLIGDTSYGKSAHNRFFDQLYDCRRLLLHASSIALTHPITGQPLEIAVAPDTPQLDQNQFQRVLSDERWCRIDTPGFNPDANPQR